jgi:ornithine decarboxylase
VGSSFDIGSPKELELVAGVGVGPERMLYSNPIRSAGQCKFALEMGVRRFVCDDFEQVEILDSVCTDDIRREMLLQVRVAVTNAGSLIRLDSKFGLPSAHVPDFCQTTEERGFRIEGLCFHVGSQASDAGIWRQALARVAGVVGERPVEKVNIGGGFPIAYREPVVDLETISAAVTSSIEEFGLEACGLMCEPGRFIAGPAGAIIASVVSRHDRNGRSWVYLDVGRFQGFGELFESERIGPRAYFGPESEGAGVGPGVLTGPSCDSFDTLFEVPHVPDGLVPGDRVCFVPAGAYTTAYGAPFNGFPIPETVILD